MEGRGLTAEPGPEVPPDAEGGIRRAWLLLHDPFSTPERAAVHLAGLGAWTVGLHYSRYRLPWDFLLVMLAGILGVFAVNSLLRRRRARREGPGLLREEVLESLGHRYRPSRVGPWGFALVLFVVVFSLLDGGLFAFAGLYVPILLLLMLADALVRLLVTDRYARALVGEEGVGEPGGPTPGG